MKKISGAMHPVPSILATNQKLIQLLAARVRALMTARK